jgi:hypothetical protein
MVATIVDSWEASGKKKDQSKCNPFQPVKKSSKEGIAKFRI